MNSIRSNISLKPNLGKGDRPPAGCGQSVIDGFYFQSKANNSFQLGKDVPWLSRDGRQDALREDIDQFQLDLLISF